MTVEGLNLHSGRSVPEPRGESQAVLGPTRPRQEPWCHRARRQRRESRTGVGKTRIAAPVAASHSLTSPPLASPAPAKTLVPSGEKATDERPYECPVKVVSTSPVAVSHILAVRSQLPVSILAPSGENATEVTEELCPEKCVSQHRFPCPIVLRCHLYSPSVLSTRRARRRRSRSRQCALRKLGSRRRLQPPEASSCSSNPRAILVPSGENTAQLAN